MKRRRIAYVLLGLSIGLGLWLLLRIGAFAPNTILVKVLGTTGAVYGVAFGSWKLSWPALDTVEWYTNSEVFVNGEPNPWPISPPYMFGYFVIEGEVVGMEYGDRWSPLFKVTQWDHIGWVEVSFCKWLSLLGLVVSIFILWKDRKT